MHKAGVNGHFNDDKSALKVTGKLWQIIIKVLSSQES